MWPLWRFLSLRAAGGRRKRRRHCDAWYRAVRHAPPAALAQVASETQAERVSGSALGGGTFTGLCRLLTGAHSFDEMLALAARGDNTQVRGDGAWCTPVTVHVCFEKGSSYTKQYPRTAMGCA